MKGVNINSTGTGSSIMIVTLHVVFDRIADFRDCLCDGVVFERLGQVVFDSSSGQVGIV